MYVSRTLTDVQPTGRTKIGGLAMVRRLAMGLFLVACVLLAGRASAGLIEFTSITGLNAEWLSLGWEFTTNRAITVSRLEFYDTYRNGLANSHEVGIFDLAQHLVVSATVVPGDPLDGWFRYKDLDKPITLDADTTYRIAAVTGGEEWAYQIDGSEPNGWTVDGAITFRGGYWSHGGPPVQYPYIGGYAYAYFGPNLDIQDASPSVPEPASLCLLGLACGGVGAMVKRRRRRP